MFFCYDETTRYTGPRVKLDRLDPHKAYKKHLYNFYFLRFIQANGTFQERARASTELAMCERKLKFWATHPKFDSHVAAGITDEMKAMWADGSANKEFAKGFAKPG